METLDERYLNIVKKIIRYTNTHDLNSDAYTITTYQINNLYEIRQHLHNQNLTQPFRFVKRNGMSKSLYAIQVSNGFSEVTKSAILKEARYLKKVLKAKIENQQ